MAGCELEAFLAAWRTGNAAPPGLGRAQWPVHTRRELGQEYDKRPRLANSVWKDLRSAVCLW
jgi:hypothetical protein